MPPIAVVAADSFKGSLDAREASQAIGRGIAAAHPGTEIRLRPMADGGEGTLDALVAATPGSRRRTIATRGATGDALDADIATRAHGDGVIEVAAIVGRTDRAATATGVHRRDTRGVGLAIRALLDDGCRTIAIGLGGSSTNDGGAGLLAALGLRFLDAAGREVAPTPEGLADLARVDARALDPRIAATRITAMSDVDNALTGARGATAVFGPQKGVAAHAVDAIDRSLAHYAALVEAALGVHAAQRPGAGAAGGLGFALQALGARYASGAAIVADLNGLDAALEGADWAIAGEGRSDAQTAMHKAPWVVAERARAKRVPVSLLSGALDPAARPVLDAAFDGCFALAPGPATLDASMARSREWLEARAFAMAQLFFSARR
jgi:glycerate kinase